MPLTKAVEEVDWRQVLSPGDREPVVAAFEALTPRGAVFLAELASVGYFGAEMIAAVDPGAVRFW